MQLVTHAANVSRDRFGLAAEGAIRSLLRLRRVVGRASDWPYSSADLRRHNRAAHRHFRAAEARIHGGGAVPPDGVADVVTDESLPSLAWAARNAVSDWVFTTGPGVEISDAGLFEGVWARPFSEFRPDLCPYAFGSGAIWHGGAVAFVPPRHLEECLFVFHRESDNLTVVSNSLAFLFVEAEVTARDPFFAAVAVLLQEHALAQGKRGVDRVWPIVASDGDCTLYQCSYFNFSVDAQGRPHRTWHPARREFGSFSEYVDVLARTTSDLFNNGSDPARRLALNPVVAVSTGYDSPAAAAIARLAGCRRALTLRANVHGHDDCGADIATALGLEVTERTHVMGPAIEALDLDSADHLFAEAAEFIATFGIGDDVVYLPFENDLSRTVLVTGTWGDSIWARGADVSSGLPVRIPFGKSLTEFRLRVGFAHLPLPFIGGRFAEPARRLSRSAEMRPYRIGGEYDRPIPRRIAEEAGVARESFGTRKTATAPWLKNHEELFPESMTLVMERYRRCGQGDLSP